MNEGKRIKWISGRLTAELHARLKAWSKISGIKIQHVLSEAVREYLDKHA